jgi:hypothetical protein
MKARKRRRVRRKPSRFDPAAAAAAPQWQHNQPQQQQEAASAEPEEARGDSCNNGDGGGISTWPPERWDVGLKCDAQDSYGTWCQAKVLKVCRLHAYHTSVHTDHAHHLLEFWHRGHKACIAVSTFEYTCPTTMAMTGRRSSNTVSGSITAAGDAKTGSQSGTVRSLF